MPPLVGEVVMSPPTRAPTDTRMPNPDSTPRPSEKTPGPPFSSASAPSRSESGGTARAGSARARAATQTANGRARRIKSLLRIRSVPWHGGAADFLGDARRFGLPVVCGGGTPLSPMLFFAFLLLAQPTPIGPPSATQRPALAAEGPAGWREEFDELWRHRDESAAGRLGPLFLQASLAQARRRPGHEGIDRGRPRAPGELAGEDLPRRLLCRRGQGRRRHQAGAASPQCSAGRRSPGGAALEEEG